MQPIDKPFRFTFDFCIVWALLAVPVFLLARHSDFVSPWYTYAGLLILLSLFAAFVLYGPVLLVRQVTRSGSRGFIVMRIFISLLLVAVLIFGGIVFIRFLHGEPGTFGRVCFCIFVGVATTFLSWRSER